MGIYKYLFSQPIFYQTKWKIEIFNFFKSIDLKIFKFYDSDASFLNVRICSLRPNGP